MRGARFGAGVLAMCFGLVWARGARAQERLHFELVGDERLWGMTVQRPKADPQHVRVEAEGGVSGSQIVTADSPAIVAPFVGFGLGVSPEPTRLLQIYSETLAPLYGAPATGGFRPTRWSDFEGLHRARAAWGFGNEREEGETGVDVEAEGKIAHATSSTTSFLRRDLPALPFWDGEATARLWPRVGGKDEQAFVAPVSWTVRRVRFGEQGEGGFTSQRATAGVGLRPYDRATGHGWLELVGLAWESARFDGAAGAPAPSRFTGIDRIDVRALHVDGVYFMPESDTVLDMGTSIGGAWVWDPATKQQASTFTGEMTMAMHVLSSDDHADAFGIGFAFARRAGYLADATALTRGWRLEAFTDAAFAHDRIRASVRGAFEQLSILRPGVADDADAGWKSAIASDLSYAPTDGLELGVFHVATDRCPPYAALATTPVGDAFCHQLGGFLRVRERWSTKLDVPPPPKEEGGDPPTPAPAEPPPVAVE